MCVLDIQKLKYSQLFSDVCLAVSTVDSEQLYREFCSIFSIVLDANGKQKHDKHNLVHRSYQCQGSRP